MNADDQLKDWQAVRGQWISDHLITMDTPLQRSDLSTVHVMSNVKSDTVTSPIGKYTVIQKFGPLSCFKVESGSEGARISEGYQSKV